MSPTSTTTRSPETAPPTKADLLSGAKSTGRFTFASGTTKTVGRGPLVTYAVAVENGIALSPKDFAREVDGVLSAKDGWAGRGEWSLRRVKASDADLVIRLATPKTVDAICASGGLKTEGYASCRVGRFAMINLARWAKAIPAYRGDLLEYHRYVVNHEVGHGLGLGHAVCTTKASPAPVMQQQTYAMHGCKPNGRVYVAGKRVTGAFTP